MISTIGRHKAAAAAAVVLTLAAFIWVLLAASGPASAQPPFQSLRAFQFGPVALGPGQTLQMSYSNLFGDRAFWVRMRFFDATTGQSIGAGFGGFVQPGQMVSYNPSPNQSPGALSAPVALWTSGNPVIGVMELADPRPTPIASFQVLSTAGIVALADPRPTPLADPRPTP